MATKDYAALQLELNSVLAALQDDTTDIDEAVKLYERGMELVGQLETHLKEASNTITKLQKKFDQ